MNLLRSIAKTQQIGVASQYSSGNRAGFAIDSAYSHGVSGDAVGIRFLAQTTDTIDEVYIFLDDVAGAPTLECAIYNENASYSTRAGSTLRDTSTATSSIATDTWVKFTFGTPYTPAVGEILWAVVYNTHATPESNYPTVLNATTLDVQARAHSQSACLYTNNGWSGNGSACYEMPHVIKQGSNYIGQPFTQVATVYSSGTLERGIQFTPPCNVTVAGVMFYSASTPYSDFRILADSTVPGGTALYTYDLDSDSNETTADLIGCKLFDAPVTLSGGVTYKATLTFGSAYTQPSCMQIEDYASHSTMFDALRAQDTFLLPWSVIDDGASGWTVDKSIAPMMGLLVSDFPMPGGGGGVTATIGSPFAG